MAISKCGACESKTFEIKVVEPAAAQYKHYFVQCQKCGVPVGVIDYRNSAKLIEEMKEELVQGQRVLAGEIQRVLTHVQDLGRGR